MNNHLFMAFPFHSGDSRGWDVPVEKMIKCSVQFSCAISKFHLLCSKLWPAGSSTRSSAQDQIWMDISPSVFPWEAKLRLNRDPCQEWAEDTSDQKSLKKTDHILYIVNVHLSLVCLCSSFYVDGWYEFMETLICFKRNKTCCGILKKQLIILSFQLRMCIDWTTCHPARQEEMIKNLSFFSGVVQYQLLSSCLGVSPFIYHMLCYGWIMSYQSQLPHVMAAPDIM